MKGLSQMWLKSQVRFLEEGERVIAISYSTRKAIRVGDLHNVITHTIFQHPLAANQYNIHFAHTDPGHTCIHEAP